MRVLIINSMFVNAVYRRCADELGKLPGIDLTMLTTDYWYMNGKVMPLDPIKVGAPYHTVIGQGGWRGKENRGFYVTGLRKAFEVSKPDVIYLMEEPFSIFTMQVLQARALFAPKTPVVFFTWNNLSLDVYDYRPSIFYRNVARWTLPRMNYALTANTDGIAVLQEKGVHYPIKTVGYGVDTERYVNRNDQAVAAIRSSLGINTNDVVLGYVGRFIPMKGVDLLVTAVGDLYKEGKAENIKLLLVGSGEAEKEVLELADRFGISHLIRHVPTVPHHEVPNYMHALDVLVLPSRRVGMWAEQFGRVLVEAMAAGKIVIGATSGAIPEVIGNAGFTFKENDAQDLKRSIEKVLTLSDRERETILKAAHYRSHVHYSWQRFAQDSYEAISAVYAKN